ncbi:MULTISPECIES: DoxX family protein [Paraburkholderia]|uniref:DoxX family protein n=1 Tax=Paraburkholderia dipogonis TaxID=1211383 RepID=A0A4Y8MGT3_9BURK|nr:MULTISPECIES: DoxX family protein [Paraburkholderia]RKR31335.1 DoxX-like protein [Paraburkholderia sp. BL17N1]TFE36696.1 DoxX family protein [Paraburkholderia dipogonis]
MPPSSTAVPSRSGTVLNVGLWIAQALIFAGFVVIGWIKLSKPIPELAAMWPWTGQLPEIVVRTLGIIDIAGGVGIFLPALLRIRPGLTVLAALGCVALQICALVFHASRGELAVTPVNLIFLVLATFVLWGRRTRPAAQR